MNNTFASHSRFLPELSPPSAQNLFGFGNQPTGGKQFDFQSNPSIHDKSTIAGTGNDFFGYKARKKAVGQALMKRDLNMSMTIDTSNNTLRDGFNMRNNASK